MKRGIGITPFLCVSFRLPEWLLPIQDAGEIVLLLSRMPPSSTSRLGGKKIRCST